MKPYPVTSVSWPEIYGSPLLFCSVPERMYRRVYPMCQKARHKNEPQQRRSGWVALASRAGPQPGLAGPLARHPVYAATGSGTLSAGNVIVKVVPLPASLEKPMLPPCARTVRCAVDKPRPVPCDFVV